MKKRLFNEYEAYEAKKAQFIFDELTPALDRILKTCEQDNISLRDAEAIVLGNVTCAFAGAILRAATRSRRSNARTPSI